MQRLIAAILLLGIAIMELNCQKELSSGGPNTFITPTSPVTATLQGNIVDENGDPAAGVSIKVGVKTAVTDAKGYFRIKNAALDRSTSLVTAEKAGYFKAFRVFSASQAVNQVKIKLLKKTLVGTINSTAGGVIILTNGSNISYSANSFSKESGGIYSGTVNVYATYLDPTSQDIGQTVPGSFLANDKDNKRVILTSYAMMAVELESATGEKLQIRTGNTAKLSFTVPSDLRATAPANIPLWYVDEKTGLWKEEGVAIKNGNTYSADVAHFTWWNCDIPGPTVTMQATFVNPAGQPLLHSFVSVRSASGYGTAHGFTDSLGQITGSIPANINLVLEIRGSSLNCTNIIYSQNIGPFSSNVNLGTIMVDVTQSLLTIKGKLLNCNNNPVTHGFALIQYQNMSWYAQTSPAGDFSVATTICGTQSSNCIITGFDSLAQQQSFPITLAGTSPLIDFGDIEVCGTSTIEYLNYTVDVGTPVNLISIAGDGFIANDTDTLGIHSVNIQGTRSSTQHLYFTFSGNGLPGTYAIDYLNVEGNNVTPVQPCNVVITNFPQQVGQYFEGSFSGQFRDQQGVIHNLVGDMRVRRDW